ncbi:hypothetical protein BGLA2_2170003 [Burkholderia gladioli]|nr:hypothetical protein BGLA2_2170003 [Burkholderia gladioli]
MGCNRLNENLKRKIYFKFSKILLTCSINAIYIH